MISKINRLVKLLLDKKLKIALAESITCGLASHQFCTVKGTSDVFQGCIVCYSPAVKMKLLKIRKARIEKFTTESQEVTDDLAKNLVKIIDADLHVAITGLSSSDGSESRKKPVGTVFVAVHYQNKLYRHRCIFRGEPLEIRKKSCLEIYDFVYKVIIKSL